MITEEQRIERRMGIGGSDLPIILGLSSYKTPYQLYLEKIGEIEPTFEETPVQEWGHALEPIIRIKFAEKHGFRLRAPVEDSKYASLSNLITYDLESQSHPFHEFLKGNLDGFIPELNAIHEIKCSNQFMAYEWGEDGSDVIPMQYLVQVAHYCAVMNADCAYITVLIGGHDYREFKYVRDLELEITLIEAAKQFWERVTTRTPPDASKMIDLKLMHPNHTPKKSITINGNVSEQLTTLYNIRSQLKEFNGIEEQCKFNIMKYMEDSEFLTDGTGKEVISWKTNKRGSRTFLVKGF